jgi:DNA-binding NarL/FixJ family response regulator
MTAPIRVLIADDHPVFRYGMRAILGAEPDTELVGEATDGEEAVTLAADLRPDVILMDVNMPKINGIEATRRLVESSPETGILVLTMFEDDDSVFAAMRAGARGYVLKGADGAETLRAVRAVAKGEAIFDPTIARRLMGYFAVPPQAPGTKASQTFSELTDRERDLLDLIARGYTNAAIADRLYLSPKTVRNYVSTIFTKLQVSDRAQAIIRAREAGLGRDQR